MDRSQIEIQLEIIETAFPYAWKNVETEALILVWLKTFGYVSNELFSDAVMHMISSDDKPSIKAMWDAILDIAGVPTLFDAQESMRRYVDRCFDSRVPKLEIEDHPVIKKTLRAMGDHTDIAQMGSYAQKNLADYFQENRRAYRKLIIQPNGVERLESSYRNLNQLTNGHTGQITE